MRLLTLPHPAPTPAHPAFWLAAGPPRKRRVLMVEDDLTIATMYRHQLQADGFDVHLATDGATGLHAAQEDPPDLVLLDVRLPRMSGSEVLEAMRSDPRLAVVPVVMLSNYSDANTVREATNLGARLYLVKSQTTPAELTERLKDLLAS